MNRTAKIALMVMVDLLALPVCFLVAMLLRLGDAASALQYPAAFLLVPLLTVGAFSLSDLYRAVIRFIDQRMLAVTGFTLALATLSVYLIMVGINNHTFPRSALVIYWFIAFSYVVTSRMTVRNFLRKQMNDAPAADHAVAIYGAGEPGAQLALTMRTSNQYRPVCFFDDKRAFNERTIAGLRVFHTEHLADAVRSLGVRSVIIALPSVSPQRLRDIMQRLALAGVNTRILCRLLDLADDATPLQAVRDLKLEDLLGRKPVPPRTDLFDRCVRGKRVLVTGAGGSIGSELCRQIVTLAPAHLHLVDHSEFALYTIRQELLGRHPDMRISAHLGSVCSARLVERILQENTIDTIYHAAAYKHVPLVESNIVAGLRNNVLGSQVIAAAAARFKVRTCVLISSDKAVRPTNIMGASKRIAELIFQAAAATHGPDTTFCMVRFGNVLGSSGSVIPLFQRQLAHGGPLTITHPDVSRYFMLIAEAAQLVIQAGAMAEGGDVFVLDMGEPVRIVDLARTMIMMSGLTEKTAQNPAGDIGLKFVGLFPGEKLYEELLTDGKVFPSDHPRIMRMKEHALDPGVLDTYITCLMLACNTHDRGMIESMVKAIVSEYTPQPNGAPGHRSPAAVAAPDKNRPALLRNFSPDRIE
ncbi:nucleoside-diphosphate sugar epimerase/dehydratase [Massilia sp. CCM 9210]|uniref:polysaccharide biosynthesis protein n=1 Tax=Massilia scottii TaxID=3057166 RepID=UPI002796B1FE|nr:nucleoside-diphosphate sugar epimerase/dehydratase [Massilia sp. CCM 9210]MDQ1813140.1 nucleoside-diphosphate sugar epimerase/dehydratase [Massilia sp. CCM 9210]